MRIAIECNVFATRKTAAFLYILFAIAAAITGQEVLTNDSIVKMVKAGLSESVIVQMIQSQPGKYSLTSDSLIKLKQQGVPEKVLSAMVTSGSGSPITETTDQPALAEEKSRGTWNLRDTKDPITGASGFEALLRDSANANGRTGQFQVTATCNAETIGFQIAYFSDFDKALGLKQIQRGPTILFGQVNTYKPRVDMRLRIEDGEVKVVSSESDHPNVAAVSFGMFKPGGTTKDALNARVIKVELPLSNGDLPVLEIKPQDPSFRKFVSRCYAAFPKLESHPLSITDTYTHLIENAPSDLHRALDSLAALQVCYSMNGDGASANGPLRRCGYQAI